MRKSSFALGVIILSVIFLTCHAAYAGQLLDDIANSSYKSLTGAYSSLMTKGLTETLRTSPRIISTYNTLGTIKNNTLTNLGSAGSLARGFAISSALGPIGQVGYIASKAMGISSSSLFGMGISRIGLLNQNLGAMGKYAFNNLGYAGSLAKGLSMSSAFGPVGYFSHFALKAEGVSPGLILNKGIQMMQSAGTDFYTKSIVPKVNLINNTLTTMRLNTKDYANNISQSIVSYITRNSNIESKIPFFNSQQQKTLMVEKKISSFNKK